jgi:hypothetical protein
MIALLVLMLAAGLFTLSILFALERKKCPVCQRRRVAMKFTDGYTDGITNIVSYYCKNRQCRAEFRTYNGGPLIPRDAFDEGVRVAVPVAQVVRR